VKNGQKGTLKAALRRRDIDPAARRTLGLRIGAAYDTKVDTMLARCNADGRIRGTLQFHGAGTGRWAARGVQVQNFTRDPGDIEAKIAAILAGDVGRYPQPLGAIADAARGAICAAPGHRLLIGDFSGVESRVLAWIAGEASKVAQWRKFDATQDPRDEPYEILGKAVGFPDDEARARGKILDLAFGFQGGILAYAKMTYEGDPSTKEQRERFKRIFRERHPQTVSFWYASDRAAIKAVRTPGTVHTVKGVSFECDADFLKLTLPSGRVVRYPFPRIEKNRFDEPCVMFKDTALGKWGDCNFGQGSYGGLWTENIVQAIARDLLAEAMRRLETSGYRLTLTVHDEIVCEVPDGVGSLDEFKQLLVAAPAWAADLPISAKVREGLRYSKPDPAATADAEPIKVEIRDPLDEILAGDDDDNDDVASGDMECPPRVETTQTCEMRQARAEATLSSPPKAPDIVGKNGVEGDPLSAAEGLAEIQAASLPPPELTLERMRAAFNTPRQPDEAPATKPKGNGHDKSNGHDQHAGNSHPDLSDSGAGDNDAQPAGEPDKPYGPVRAALRNKGYQLARSFEFTVPGESTPLFYEDRYELKPSIAPSKERQRKTSRFRHCKNGQDLSGTGPRRIIYNWPAIMHAGPRAEVFVTEGANKSEPLCKAGLIATAVPYHKWTPECIAALAGANLIYLEDHDLPDGKGHVRPKQYSADARAKLAAGAASFRVVPALHLWKTMGRDGEPPHGWDVKDWVEAGGDPATLPAICREIATEGDKSHDPLFWHGEPDPRPQRKWRIKQLMPAVGAGLLSGQWGTFKTFMAIELATAVIAADQQFCDRQIVEPCGVLIFATEGAFELRDRVNAAVRAKHPDMGCAPITWRESCPTLLADGAADALIKIIQEAAEGCRARFNMPIGLVIIDVLTDAAGYAKAGDENDPAVGAKLMGALRRAAEVCRCFVLAVDHFGKSIEAGTRGTSAKEGAADVVLACLGEREVSGTVANTRLALRKVRSGPQGQEFSFKARVVPLPELSEEDGPETTCVISWEASAVKTAGDPWEADRRADSKIAMRALRRAMMKLLADHGIERAGEPGFAAARVIIEELVREEFYASTVAEGTAEQKLGSKRKQFRRVRDRAEQQGLIGRREIDGQVYLWFVSKED
jgi:hypothetical protein